jgi:hypothetical protein
MKVSDAIAVLNKYNQPDDEIVFAYWTKDLFDGTYLDRTDKVLTDDEWAVVAHIIGNRGFGDFVDSMIYDQIDEVIREVTEKGN